MVSLDLDLVIAVSDIPAVLEKLGKGFEVERFPHSINVSAKGSDLRVQIQTARLLESQPELRARVPQAILDRLF